MCAVYYIDDQITILNDDSSVSEHDIGGGATVACGLSADETWKSYLVKLH
jgi:hypothetical protein